MGGDSIHVYIEADTCKGRYRMGVVFPVFYPVNASHVCVVICLHGKLTLNDSSMEYNRKVEI